MKRIAWLALLLAVLTPPFVPAIGQEQMVTLNFRDTDIKAVVKSVSEFTGKTFIIDPEVKGKLNIVGSKPVSSSAVYEIFLAAMRMNGYSVVEKDEYAMILTQQDASTEASSVMEGSGGEAGGAVVTRIFPLSYESAAQLAQTLRPLVGAKNAMVAHAESNTLIMVDFAQNMERIATIIADMDKPNLGDIHMLKFEHISSYDFIALFENVYAEYGARAGNAPAGGAPQGAQGRRLKYVMTPSGAGDQLILRTADPVVVEKAQALAALADTKDADGAEVHVARLIHADPVKVAQALTALSSGKAPAGAPPGGQPQPAGQPSQTAMAMADEANKAVIIRAPDNIYRQWRQIISQMDRRPGQIYVEALVAEVTMEKMGEFGVQWQSLRGVDPTREPHVTGIGGTNLGGAIGSVNSGVAQGNGSLGTGLALGLISGVLTLPNGTVIPNMLALARALETDANANILSTPTLLALDGEEAKMLVGQNVPLVTGSYAPNTGGAAGAVTPFQTIERRDIGLTLKIKPRITDSSAVRLEIYQEVSSLLPVTVQTGAADVVTNKRSLESRVLVEDGQIVALGGLMQERLSVNEDKAPLLGDIPIIGALFRYEKRTKSKTNLMVFIRSTIIRNGDDSAGITARSYGQTMEQQEGVQAWPYLPLSRMSSPLAPQFQLKKDQKQLPDATPENTDKTQETAQ